MGRVNVRCLGYLSDEYTGGGGRDYIIGQRGFFFDLSPWADEKPIDDPRQAPGTDQKTRKALLKDFALRSDGLNELLGFTPSKYWAGKHEDVESEWQDFKQFSLYNVYKGAGANNGSFFRLYPLQSRYPQNNLPDYNDARVKAHLNSKGKVKPGKYIAYCAGDYDGSWIQQYLPRLMADGLMADVPMGWAINPNSETTFPVGMLYARERATPQMTFISGPSGAGYANPGNFDGSRASGLDSALGLWREHCEKYYHRWDIQMSGFVMDGSARFMSNAMAAAYADFSPYGIGLQHRPKSRRVNGVPFLQVSANYLNVGDNAETGAQKMAQALSASKASKQFHLFRSILWSPKRHADAYEALKTNEPKAILVDPHTLMLLYRRYLERG